MEAYLIQITDYLLIQSWQIAILVAVVAIANLVLRNRSAHIRYLFWLIVLAKCLVPPLLTVPLAVLPQEAEPLLVSPSQVPIRATQSLDSTLAESPESQPIPAMAEPSSMVVEAPSRLTFQQWLGLGWFAGVTTFLVFIVIKTLRINHWLRQKRKLPPAKLQRNIEKLFSGLGVKILPKVWLVEGIGQPFVWGLLRGDIYLPADFAGVNSVEYRNDILGHELSHVLRFDAAVNLLQIIAQALFWFHPLVWWANRKIRAEREKCCDEMAIARLNTLAKDYSRAIVDALVTEYESVRLVPSLAVAGSVKNIEERIRTILKPGRRFYKRPSLIVMAVVLLLALVTVPTVLVLTARAETETKGIIGKPVAGKKVTCTGRVIDASGKPIAGAKVIAYEMLSDGLAGNILLRQVGEEMTVEDGAFTFATTAKPERGVFFECEIVALKQGMSLGWAEWSMREDAKLTIELGKPVKLEGVIVDEAGEPVADAEVRANLYKPAGASDERQKWEWLPGIAPFEQLGTRTNNQGKFRFSNLPANVGVDLLVMAEGKATTYTYKARSEEPAFKAAQTDIMVVLPDEARIEGKLIHDRTGRGIARAKFAVVGSNLFYYRFVCMTDDEGRFSIGGLQTGRYYIRNGGFPITHVDVKSGKTTKLTVRRKYRSYYFHVLLERGSPEVRKPKQKITVRFEENIGVRDAGFIDVDGYLKVYISDKEYRQWQLGKGWFAALIPENGGKSFRREEIFSYYDLNKRRPKNITTKETEPKDEPSLLIGKSLPGLKDFGIDLLSKETNDKVMLVCLFDMDQRPSRNCMIQLTKRAKELKQKGVTVVAIQALKVEKNELDTWVEKNNIPFAMGIVQRDETKTSFIWGVKSLPWLILTDNEGIIRAEGFSLEQLDEKLREKDSNLPAKVQRKQSQPGQKIHGVVLDQEDKPVEGATLRVLPGGSDWATSDATGKWETSWDPGRWVREDMIYYLVARHKERNLASAVMLEEDVKTLDIKLEPGVTLTGKVVDPNGEGIAGVRIQLYKLTTGIGGSSLSREHEQTDSDGRFEAKGIPADQAGSCYIHVRADGYGEKDVLPEASADIVDNRLDFGEITLRVASLSVSGVVVDVDDKPVSNAHVYCYGDNQPQLNMQTDAEGKFTLGGICEGRVWIGASVSGKTRLRGSVETEGGATDVKVVVSESSSGRRYPPSLVGKAMPELKNIGVEGFSDEAANKKILLCFFDLEQRPSRNCISQMVQRAEQIKNLGLAVVIMQVSKIEEDSFNKWIKENSIPYAVGMVRGDATKTRFTYGIKSLPWLILTDKEHIVRAEGFSVHELDDKMTELGEK